jgi:hypothetical protein
MVWVIISEHPFTPVPVTKYTVVKVGLTEILVVVAPEFHEYVVAPLAVSVVELPEQIEDDVVFILIIGNVISWFTETVFDIEHPFIMSVVVTV